MEKFGFISSFLFIIVSFLSSFVSMEFTNSFTCYCNLVECGPSRLCRSRDLGCFSELTNDADVRTATHGCLNLLSLEKQSQCQNVPGAHVSSSAQKSLLLCCQKDRCNFEPENFPILNITAGQEFSPTNKLYYREQNFWYKAATVAVPICVFLILSMIILVGLKILKSDNVDEQILMSKLREKHGHCAVSSIKSTNTSSLKSSNSISSTGNIVPLLPARGYLQDPPNLIGVHVNNWSAPQSTCINVQDDNVPLTCLKICNANTSEILLKDINKPNNHILSNLNENANAQCNNNIFGKPKGAVSKDKINYKQSLISSWVQ